MCTGKSRIGRAPAKRWTDAARLLNEAHSIARAAGDREVLALVLHSLAVLHNHYDDTDAAQACLEEALALRRELGDILGALTAGRRLGASSDRQPAQLTRLGNTAGVSWGVAECYKLVYLPLAVPLIAAEP